MRAPFSLKEPEPSRETPLVVEIPHAGLDVPPELALTVLAPARAIARDADLYVDTLYEGATDEGATLIAANVSRYVVDLNRSEADVDSESVTGARSAPKAPRGLIWRLSTDGDACIPGPLSARELAARLAAVYRPYHAAVARAIEHKRKRFGFAIVLAAHSMPGSGRSGHGDAGTPRADVVPGTQGRTTAEHGIIEAVETHARKAGLSLRHDDPYRGGFTTRHWGRPDEGVHAVQVEIARRLYMDEATLVPRNGAFDTTRTWCRELVARLGQHVPTRGRARDCAG